MQKRRQQSSIATRVIAVILAIILALGIAYGVTAIVKKQANPIKWFEDEKTVEEKSPVGTMMLEFDNKADAPMKIGYKPTSKTSDMATSAAATIDEPTAQNVAKGNSIEVAVTTNPVDASIQTVTWGVAWTSSSASWAQEKNAMDYIQIEPSEEDTKHATITCLQPFGATITIICTSDDKDDGTVSATCKAQYAKRITSAMLFIKGEGTPINEENSKKIIDYQATPGTNNQYVYAKDCFYYGMSFNRSVLKSGTSKYYIIPSEGTGTIREFRDLSTISNEAMVIASDFDCLSERNEYNLSLTLRLDPEKKQELATATGLQLPDYEYEMDGANIDVKQAVDSMFGGETNVTNKRGTIYNRVQSFYDKSDTPFQFHLTFTGVSGTKYEFNYKVNINLAKLRTPVQSLPGLDDEYIF